MRKFITLILVLLLAAPFGVANATISDAGYTRGFGGGPYDQIKGVTAAIVATISEINGEAALLDGNNTWTGTNAFTAGLTGTSAALSGAVTGATGAFTSTLSASGVVTANSTLTVKGATGLTGSLEVDGAANFDGNTAFAGTTNTFTNGAKLCASCTTLTQYAEGTFTPSFSYNATQPTTWTQTAQAGEYTRIGNSVMIDGVITWSAYTAGAASGTLRINLPFTASATHTYVCQVAPVGFTPPTGGVHHYGLIVSGTAYLNIYSSTMASATSTASSWGTATGGYAVGAAGSLTFNCRYQI